MKKTKQTKQEYEEIIERLANNPKIQRAIKGLLAPLKQEGDSLIISFKGELFK